MSSKLVVQTEKTELINKAKKTHVLITCSVLLSFYTVIFLVHGFHGNVISSVFVIFKEISLLFQW